MKKIKFPKTYVDVTPEELGVEGGEGVIFRMWDNPSKPVVNNILSIVNAQPDELLNLPEHKLNELDTRFNEAVCALIVDSNIEGLSFDTVDDIEAAYSSPDLPIDFLHLIVVGYITKLLRENERVKKTAALFIAVSGSGRDEKPVDSA